MAADDVDEMVAALEREYEQTVIELTTEIVANLREDTPVRTGHARANWVPSKGSPFDREDGFVKVYQRSNAKRGIAKGDGRTTAGGAASRGDAQILSYTLKDGDAFVTNNVRYIVGPGSLNDGHSSQAAAGFIEAAVSRAIVMVASSRDHLHDLVGIVVTDVRF